jgi:DnaJ-class molecular chaperone
MRGGFQYQNNCYEIFDNFFLKMNPYYEICDKNGSELEGSLFGTAFGGLNQPKPEKMDDIHVKVELTIKEIYCGVRKEVTYER